MSVQKFSHQLLTFCCLIHCSVSLNSAPTFAKTKMNTSSYCSRENFQECKSCRELSLAISKSEPNAGDFLHGAQWNGLYTAYVHNCLNVGKSLLDIGADPNWGGIFGSMIMSVVDKWPHNDERINREWAELLLKYGANAHKKIPDENATPVEMVKNGHFKPDYPDLWKLFLN